MCDLQPESCGGPSGLVPLTPAARYSKIFFAMRFSDFGRPWLIPADGKARCGISTPRGLCQSLGPAGFPSAPRCAHMMATVRMEPTEADAGGR